MRTLHSRAVLLAAILLWAAGCGGGGTSTTADQVVYSGHVHGLAINPADDRLYIGAHAGLFVIKDSKLQRVGAGLPDLMGLTVLGPDTFLASGHPGLLDLPNPLGLVRSDDSGRSWTPVSLQGQADLHTIDAQGSFVLAHDATSSKLLRSTDSGVTFDDLGQAKILDVALNDAGDALITDVDGKLFRLAATSSELVRAASSPPLAQIAWAGDFWAGVDARGRTWRSADGSAWQRRGAIPEPPNALAASGERWYVATERGFFVSDDQGHAWERL